MINIIIEKNGHIRSIERECVFDFIIYNIPNYFLIHLRLYTSCKRSSEITNKLTSSIKVEVWSILTRGINSKSFYNLGIVFSEPVLLSLDLIPASDIQISMDSMPCTDRKKMGPGLKLFFFPSSEA